jgi:hypothetical protein
MNNKYKLFLEKIWYLNFFDNDYINLKKINKKNNYIFEYKKRIYPDIFKFD